MGKKAKMSKPNMALTLKGGQYQKEKNISFWSWEKRQKGDKIKGSLIFGRQKKKVERGRRRRRRREEKKEERRRKEDQRYGSLVFLYGI